MDIRIKASLYDILNAIIEIDSFIIDIPKDFNAYQNDLKTRRAIERNIEIIGEAMKRILVKDDSIEISNAHQIVDTRNILGIELFMDMTQFLTKLSGRLFSITYPF